MIFTRRVDMKSTPNVPATIDEYIAAAPKEVQAILKKVRAVIRKAAPDAGETIKYRLATFTLDGNLVHFGAFRHHIGFYPTPSGTTAFRKELAPYVFAKGSIQFPLDKPIPYGLIEKIVKFRVAENRAKAEGRDKKKK
jgi:uncharacterized protein YdhG (YjbR/CyaY superfamily)